MSFGDCQIINQILSLCMWRNCIILSFVKVATHMEALHYYYGKKCCTAFGKILVMWLYIKQLLIKMCWHWLPLATQKNGIDVKEEHKRTNTQSDRSLGSSGGVFGAVRLQNAFFKLFKENIDSTAFCTLLFHWWWLCICIFINFSSKKINKY